MKELKIEIPNGYEIDKEKSTFEKIVFKEKNTLPMSWEEVVKNRHYTENYFTAIEHTSGFEYVWAHTPIRYYALRKLEILRDIWNDGWKADWKDGTTKYVAYIGNGEIIGGASTTATYPLNFKTRELRDLFMETFKDLINEAKPLL